MCDRDTTRDVPAWALRCSATASAMMYAAAESKQACRVTQPA